jgi:hypothetical protein
MLVQYNGINIPITEGANTASGIANCYATGNVTGANTVGGLVGNNQGTIRNSVAVNGALLATVVSGAQVNRIAGVAGTLQNNHALENMITQYNGVDVTITEGENIAAGVSQSLSNLVDVEFYQTSSNWNSLSSWDICGNPMPCASTWKICLNRTLPYFLWQQDITCNPMIIAGAGAYGTITPSGHVNVAQGSNQSFAIIPNAYFEIDTLWVDGIYSSVVPITGGIYTFNNVNEVHSISVKFKIAGLCAGNGKLASPYQICTEQQLANLSAAVNAGNGNATIERHFILMNDLNLVQFNYSGGWIPIGNVTAANQFHGAFNGNNKVVRNMFINRRSDNQGLFGYIQGATIKNLGVDRCNITANANTGGLVGQIYSNCNIDYCYATGVVNGNAYAGGLVGNVYSSGNNIRNSYSQCKVTGTGSNIGGLTGLLSTSNVINCYASGDIKGSNYVGGLVGYNDRGTIRNCVAANASVIATQNAANVNRIAGYTYSSATCQNNYARENMTVLTNGSAPAPLGTIANNTIAGESIP